MKNKLLKFLKNFATFFVMVTLSFSNIPFNLLTGAIDGYVKTSNIVDQAWHLSQEGNVVDNFVSSYRNKNIALLDKLAGNLKINEAHAAASYVGGVTCARAGSTGTALTCSLTALTGGSNTSPSQDDIVIAVVSTGAAADRAIGVTNAGYTELPELYANGTTYDTNLSVSWKVMGATPDSSVNFSASGSTADAISAVVHVWRGIDTGTPFDVTNQSITGTGTGRPNPPPITPVTSGATVIAIGAGAAGTGAVYTAAGLANFRTVASVDTNDSMTGMGSFAWSSGTYDSAQWTGGTANAADSWASYTLALRPLVPVTTISNFVSGEPGNSTIAPNASGMVDSFGLATNAGTDTVTAATVGLAAGMGQYIQTVAITNDGDTVTYCSVAPSGDTASLSSCTVPVTTTNTQFKIKLTAKTHASMPAPAGGSYGVTATVTGWTGTNTTHSGTDSGSSTLTIDNASPGGTTGAGATSGENAQSVVSWTNPGDGDFQQVYIYCKTSSIVGGEAPTEGTDPAMDATACDGTARMKYKGTASPQTITGLTNGTPYYFRIYARDTNGNFTAIASTQEVSATPTLTQTLTVGTVGTQAVNLNSGSTAQHIGGAGTAAFTLQINTGSSNVTSVKVSDTGTVAMANLANPKLYYENAVNPASCAYGGAESFVSGAAPVGETVTFTLPSVAVGLTANVTCLYFVSDVSSSVSGGQTIELQITNPSTDVAVSSGVNDDTVAKAITGTTTIRPNVTSITYPDAGQSGGRVGETMTVNGAGFGTTCDANNKVAIGAYTLSCTGATFNNTTISIAVDSGIPATNDGGTGGSGLLVTIGSTADDANQTYYVLPSIMGVTNCSSLPAGSKAREYASGDVACGNGLKDGEVVITGTHFGAAGSVTILTQTATQAIVAGFCGDVAYKADGTCISVQVPATINDSTYAGNVVVTRTAGTKTDTLTGFRVLPRITGLVNSSDSIGQPITVNGNHFCQSGSCPGVFAPANRVTFNVGVDATAFTSWSNIAIVTVVPSGTITGDVVVTSDTNYATNGSTFTLVSTVPNDPTNPKQYKSDGTTEISAGGTASTTSVVLKADLTAGIAINMIIQVEVEDVLTGFDGVGIVDGTVVGGGGCTSCTSLANAQVTVSGLTDNIKHWRARAKNTTTSEVSAWVDYGTSSINETDFKIDTTPPEITTLPSSGSPSTNSASITWATTNEQSTSQVQYQAVAVASCTAFSFASSCSTNNDCTAVNASLVYSPHTTALSNLNSGTDYCYRVRSKDAVGNERIDTNNYSFQTLGNLDPAKTTRFHITGQIDPISNGSPLVQTFTVFMPESATSTKSAFVEVVGIYTTTAGSPTIRVQVNGEAFKDYVLPPISAKSHFRILHQVSSMIVEIANANTLYVTPGTNTTVYVNSADINVNYSYTP